MSYPGFRPQESVLELAPALCLAAVKLLAAQPAQVAAAVEALASLALPAVFAVECSADHYLASFDRLDSCLSYTGYVYTYAYLTKTAPKTPASYPARGDVTQSRPRLRNELIKP